MAQSRQMIPEIVGFFIYKNDIIWAIFGDFNAVFGDFFFGEI
jgi:hypothetical protein